MITREEARTMVKASSTAIEIERSIDEDIKAAALIDNWPLRLAVKGWNRRALDAVLLKYSEAGWLCGYIADTREGDYIQFEEP